MIPLRPRPLCPDEVAFPDQAEPPPNINPFSTRLRLVPTQLGEPKRYASEADKAFSAVEHDGRTYNLAELIRHLSFAEVRQIDDTAPRSGQELWDEVAKRWLVLAAEIVAACTPFK